MVGAHFIAPMLLAAGLAGAPGNPMPFDVVSDHVDPFNPPLLLNPRWGLQATTGDRDRLPVLGHDCRLGEGGMNAASAWTSGQSPCTRDSVTTTEGRFCGGHVNWFPVAYEGTLCWQDHHGGILGDDDYNFRLLRTDRALHTGISPAWVVAEFDSDETVDRFTAVPWWHRFHDLVDEEDEKGSGFDGARNEICGKRAYVIGLVSYDTNHGGHSELHPVFAVAVHVDDRASDDTWAFFVRNWGNQGGCAHGEYRLDAPNPLVLFLPRPGASGVSFGGGSMLASNSKTVHTAHEMVRGRGVILSFDMPRPEEHAWIAGEVHLRWDQPAALPPLPADERRTPLTCALNGCWMLGKHGPPVRAKKDGGDDDDDDWASPVPITPREHAALNETIEHMTSAQRIAYRERYRALRTSDLALAGILRPVLVNTIPAGTRPAVVASPLASSRAQAHTITLRVMEVAPSKQQRQLEALCGVLGGRIGNSRICARIESLSLLDIGQRATP